MTPSVAPLLPTAPSADDGLNEDILCILCDVTSVEPELKFYFIKFTGLTIAIESFATVLLAKELVTGLCILLLQTKYTSSDKEQKVLVQHTMETNEAIATVTQISVLMENEKQTGQRTILGLSDG